MSNAEAKHIYPKVADTEATAAFEEALRSGDLILKRRCFASYTFYLDNLDSGSLKRIERGIKLLGASIEAFFSNQCTHIITNKPIPEYINFLDNVHNCPDPERYKNAPRDAMIEKAIEWGKTLWSTDVMLKTVEFLLHSQRGRITHHPPPAPPKRKLDAMLKEEKLYGSHTVPKQSPPKKLKFKPFTGHYIMVQDVQQIFRPPVLKIYTQELFTEKQPDYPWPYIKNTHNHKSPFTPRVSDSQKPAAEGAPKEAAVKEQQQGDQQVQEAANKSRKAPMGKNEETKACDVQALPEQNQALPEQNQALPEQNQALPEQNQVLTEQKQVLTEQKQVLPEQKQAVPKIQAMHYTNTYKSNQGNTIYDHTRYAMSTQQLSTVTTRANTTTQTLPPVSSTTTTHTHNPEKNHMKKSLNDPAVQQFTRRMVEVPRLFVAPTPSKTQPSHLQSVSPAVSRTNKENILRKQRDKHDRRRLQPRQQGHHKIKKEAGKKNFKFCEICSKLFESYEEHCKEPKHAAFVSDERNWATLDTLINTTKRRLQPGSSF
ncbi:hypothetical protein BDF20DRAFT_910420 [Mycotypha africana]|uniref:uncharacterized protein n=1 Tax=Mycotypha africana TaxID=64632 RepID=UPI0023000FDF|nr:uncharacterized protein BDF20DRAFT_910420 [Mycotypha africana]KAI8987876.1 hypothetical protein BDF20DRAFT_910420 [Mycotypha africana]